MNTAHITDEQARAVDETAEFARTFIPAPVTWAGCPGDCHQGRKPCDCSGLVQTHGAQTVDTFWPIPRPEEMAVYAPEDQAESADEEVMADLLRWISYALAACFAAWLIATIQGLA